MTINRDSYHLIICSNTGRDNVVRGVVTGDGKGSGESIVTNGIDSTGRGNGSQPGGVLGENGPVVVVGQRYGVLSGGPREGVGPVGISFTTGKSVTSRNRQLCSTQK